MTPHTHFTWFTKDFTSCHEIQAGVVGVEGDDDVELPRVVSGVGGMFWTMLCGSVTGGVKVGYGV
jgi:hypothetical protein